MSRGGAHRLGTTISGCPAAFRFAFSADKPVVVSSVNRPITAACCTRAAAQAATSRAVGAVSAPCIAIAAASSVPLAAVSVGPAWSPAPRPPAAPAKPPAPLPPRPPAPAAGRRGQRINRSLELGDSLAGHSLQLPRERTSGVVSHSRRARAVVHLRRQRREEREISRRRLHAWVELEHDRLRVGLAVNRQSNRVRAGSRPRRVDRRVGSTRHGRRGAAAAPASLADWLVAHVPPHAVHPSACRDDHRRRRPVQRQAAVGRVRGLLADLVVGDRINGRRGIRHRVGARVRAHHAAGRVEDLDLHRARRVLREEVVEDRARRRVLARRDLRRPRRRIVHAEPHAHRGHRLDEVRGSGGLRRADRCRLAQRRHVVEDPEPAAVRRGDEIRAQAGRVVFHRDVADRDRRHVEPQRLPVIAIVERHPHLRVGGGVEQTRSAADPRGSNWPARRVRCRC